MKNLAVFIAIIIFFSLSEIRAQSVGEAAPDFEVNLLSEETFKLSDYKGKVVVVFLFGNTCPYCISAGPSVESDLHQQFKDDPNFVIVGVDTWNSSSSSSSVNGFKNSTGITFPLAVKAGSVATLYGTTYDRLMVIDNDGVLVHKGSGPTSSDLSNVVNAVAIRLANIEEVDLCEGVDVTIGEINGEMNVMTSQNYNYSVTAEDGLGVQWTVSGGTLISGQGTSMVEVQWGEEGAGMLMALGSNADGCNSNEVKLDITISDMTTGIEDRNLIKRFVYPNPVSDMLFIDVEGEVGLTFFDLTGRQVLTSSSKQLDLASLPVGIYSLSIVTEKGSFTERILKQ